MKLPDTMQQSQEEVKPQIEIEAPGFKFKIGNDGWSTVLKAVVLVLTVVAGVKLIIHYL